MDYKFNALRKFLEEKKIEFSEKQEESFGIYYEKLVEVNKNINLTAITEFNEVEEKHFIDSVALASYIDINKIDSIIDIGTGAGFPGIPLKIVFPHLNVTLVDSLNKRIAFLNDTIDTLELRSITAIHGRAENLAHDKEYRESYDLCVSRAVANLSTLSELCIPFVKVGGYFISYKSSKIDEELESARKAISILGGNIEKMEKESLGNYELGRSFLFIKKEKETVGKYPRKTGTPAKKPL